MMVNNLSEKDIQYQIIDYLGMKKIYCWRQNVGCSQYMDKQGRKRFVRYGFPGVADIIGILPNGQFLAIEVKSAKGELNENQKIFKQNIDSNNGVYIVARDLDTVEKVINSVCE